MQAFILFNGKQLKNNPIWFEKNIGLMHLMNIKLCWHCSNYMLIFPSFTFLHFSKMFQIDSEAFKATLSCCSNFVDVRLKLPSCVCPQAQAFYERELEAMKRTQQLTADNLLAWKRTEAELRREFQTQEAALQKTLGKLRAELAKVTDEARENRDKSHKLQASLTAAESNIKVSVDLERTIAGDRHQLSSKMMKRLLWHSCWKN